MGEEAPISVSGPFRIKVTIELDSEEEANAIGKALKVDDDDFIKTSIDGKSVTAFVEASNIDTARRAADDWLACLMSLGRS